MPHEDTNAALLAWYQHIVAERMATNDETARVLQELGQLDANPRGDPQIGDAGRQCPP
jgi:hypothetical protein